MMSKQVLWLTGVSGAGKTTTAKKIQELWHCPSILLDGDNIRQFWPELGLSAEDRKENVLRMGRLAHLLADQLHDILIIVACIAPYSRDRDTNRKLINTVGTYHEVHIKASLSERIRRDPKGLYKKAISKEIINLTGYDGVYEEPTRPLLSVDTSQQTVDECAMLILDKLTKEIK